MQRHNVIGLRAALMAADMAVTGVALVVAGQLRFGDAWTMVWREHLPRPGLGLAAMLVLAVVTFWLTGLYRLNRRFSFWAEVGDVLRGSVVLAFVVLAVLFLFDLDNVSRVMMIVFFDLEVMGLLVVRSGLRVAFRRARSRGRALRHVLVVGSGPGVLEMVTEVENDLEQGIVVEGYLGNEAIALGHHGWLGVVADLPEVLSSRVIDEVLVVPSDLDWSLVERVVHHCELHGKTVRIPTETIGRSLRYGRVETTTTGVSLLTLEATPERAVALAAKRCIDVVGGLAGLVLAAPIMTVVALAVLVSDGRPVLYRSERAGIHGRPIIISKFRTMVRGADELRGDLSGMNDRRGPDFKIFEDPRITRLGRFLRKSSLDELPQLLDVVTGRLSLVGPRAQRLDEVAGYDEWHRRRLSMKPGLTGLWQVEARRDPSFDARVEWDLRYIDEWNLALDARILARTIPAVVAGGGD